MTARVLSLYDPAPDKGGVSDRVALVLDSDKFWDLATGDFASAGVGAQMVAGPELTERWREEISNGTDPHGIIPRLTALVAWQLHELTETVHLDGEEIFEPHGPDGTGSNVDVILPFADQVARWMLSSLPRA